MSNVTIGPAGAPVPLSGHWVLASLDGTADTQVQLHISISVSPTEELTGADLVVELVADGQPLTQTEVPAAGSALPVMESRGLTAFAQYTFENPQNLNLGQLTVTLQGESTVIDLANAVS